jgi:hypothetical protein
LRRRVGGALAICAVAALAVALAPGRATADGQEDTAWLQAMLDEGGQIFLPKLPDGRCYRTRGLWVTRSGTRIASDGACIVYLGAGPVRLTSSDGDPIAANAIFFVNRSSTGAELPHDVSISNLQLKVPDGTDGYGVLVAGSEVKLSNLKIIGAPLDAVTVTGRANGRGYAGPVTIKGSRFVGARRNGISVVGAIGVTIDSNVITGAGNAHFLGRTPVSYTGPWAGIDLEPDTLSYPIKKVTVSNNKISDNGGAGILMALATNAGLPTVADQITLSGNAITHARAAARSCAAASVSRAARPTAEAGSPSPRIRSSATAGTGSAGTPRASRCRSRSTETSCATTPTATASGDLVAYVGHPRLTTVACEHPIPNR